MIEKGSLAQLNNDHHVSLSVGQIIIQAGTEGEVETPGETRARVRFTETISALVPVRLLNELQ